MRLTLHVGLKKTATTTLQVAFAQGKPVLAAAGLLFPGGPDLHHRLARRIRLAGTGEAGAVRKAREVLRPLVAEARAAGLPQVLVSSEHLISMPEASVAVLRDLLAEEFPEATEIRVLAYVREPVGFATSMCQQGLKNGIFRLEEFFADPWPFAIADWLATYVRVFGRANVDVRHFHPEHLLGGNILIDCLHVLGLSGDTLPVEVRRRNVGLSWEAVLVADALAGLRPGAERLRDRRGAYRRLLGKIGGAQFVLPDDVQQRVIAAAADDMLALKAMFGQDIRPEPVAATGVPPLTPEAAMALARAILQRVEG